MFEDSLFSSTPSRNTARLRWFVAASVLTQSLLVAAVLVAPLVWPAVLPVVAAAPRVTTVSLRNPPRPQPPKPIPLHASNQAAIHAPSPATATVNLRSAGATIARIATTTSSAEAPLLTLGTGMGGGFSTLPSLASGPGGNTGPIVRPASPAPANHAGPVRVSTGVSAGLLLAPIRPVYPGIAKATHTEGIVLLTAIIGRDGRISNLQVLSGPMMLRNAALEAVRAARYRPFLLNGASTEVVTTVSVVFTIAG